MSEIQDILSTDITPSEMSPIVISTTTSPSDTTPSETIPITTSSISPAKAPTAEALRSWLPLYVKRADRTVEHLNRIFSTPSGTDTILMALCYSSLAASNILSSISMHRLHNAALKLISAASNLPANTTILIDATDLPTPRLLRASQSLKALSGVISDFRIFARMWGLLEMWSWAKGVWKDPPTDSVVKRIVWAEIVVNVLFQSLENGAYLASKGVLGWTAEKQTNVWLWSSRFWAAHVGLEFLRLGRERRLRQLRKAGHEIKGEGFSVEGTVVADVSSHLLEEQSWRKALVVNTAFAPLTVHWSLESGLVGDLWVGIFGSVAGAVKMMDLWKKTS